MGVRVVFPDMGKDPSVQLIEKTITENGTYDAITDGANGYSKVNVNVEGGGSGGGGETWNTVFEGNVTTEVKGGAQFANGKITGVESLTADTIKVTFNGVEYTCEKRNENDSYGAPFVDGDYDWSEYPFCITTGLTGLILITQSAGTYSLKIEEPQSGGGGSSDLSTATVTIIRDTSEGEDLLSWENCPAIISDLVTGTMYTEISPAVITVPLYKGKCYWERGTQGLTLSGNIEEYYDGEGMLITGDCTITIS